MTCEFPSDIESCHKDLASYKQVIQDLTLQIKQLKKRIFGQSSESRKFTDLLQGDMIQGDLFRTLEEQIALLTEIEAAEEAKLKSKEELKKSNPEGKASVNKGKVTRGRALDYSNLPVEEIHHGEDIKACPCCLSDDITEMPEERCTTLEFIPAKLYREEHVTHKYKCRHCSSISRAEKPQRPIEKGIAGPSLLTQILYTRFDLHLPYFRLERDFKNLGATISRTNMCNWMNALAENTLGALYQEIKSQVLNREVVYCDETVVKEQNNDKDRARGKRKCSIKYIWAYSDPDAKYVFYDYSDRNRKNPSSILDKFNGRLVTDKYAGYSEICERFYRLTFYLK